MCSDPIDVLARTIYGEARGLGRGGMSAVASVVLNRAAHPSWWGSDVVSVCLEPAQFSCWDTGTADYAALIGADSTDQALLLALGIADDAVKGRLADATRGANSYYDMSITAPYWAIPAAYTATIGTLKFYRL